MMSTGTTTAKSIGGSGLISGWCITAGDKFGVTDSGTIWASDANISGKITSTDGSIGGFTLSANKISANNGNFYMSSNTSDFALYVQGLQIGHNGGIVTSSTISANNSITIGGSGCLNLSGTANAIQCAGEDIMKLYSAGLLQVGYPNNYMRFYKDSASGVHIRINNTLYKLSVSGGYVKATAV